MFFFLNILTKITKKDMDILDPSYPHPGYCNSHHQDDITFLGSGIPYKPWIDLIWANYNDQTAEVTLNGGLNVREYPTKSP